MKMAIVYHSETGNTKRMAELVCEGAQGIQGLEARIMPVENCDHGFLREARVVAMGSPTYEGTCSWQMKRFLDTAGLPLEGKLGGVFASQNWPGGGGADLAEITIIAGMLVRGMLIYAGGMAEQQPILHFGAVSTRRPRGLDEERCRRLGENLARKGLEIFGETR